MAISYYVTRLSENIGHTPEGYLVARDVVIARTGTQEYYGKELPQDEVKNLGLLIQPEEKVSVYRSPEEVFSAETIGSFEGKPVCDGHPGRFLAVEEIHPVGEDKGYYAIKDYQKGHTQNLRRGDEPLESGDYPLLADMVITDPNLIQKIDGGLREVSAGYHYHLALEGDQLLQVAMLGNHSALVRKGRAGTEARIYDEAPQATETVADPELQQVFETEHKPVPEIAAPAVEQASPAASAETGKPNRKREYMSAKDWLNNILGRGLKEYAKDASPEELSEAVSALNTAQQPAVITTKPARANDAVATEEKTEAKKEAKATNSGDESRGRLHRALDHLMDKRATDAQAADIEELKKLTGEGKDDDPDPEMTDAEEETEKESEKEAEAEDEEEGEKEKESDAEGRDSAEFIEPIPMGEKVAKKVATRGNDTIAMLRELRPFVARSKDPKLKKAYNAIAARANDAVKSGDGSYKEFHKASRTASAEANDSTGADKNQAALKSLQDFYKQQGNLENLKNSRRVN